MGEDGAALGVRVVRHHNPGPVGERAWPEGGQLEIAQRKESKDSKQAEEAKNFMVGAPRLLTRHG